MTVLRPAAEGEDGKRRCCGSIRYRHGAQQSVPQHGGPGRAIAVDQELWPYEPATSWCSRLRTLITIPHSGTPHPPAVIASIRAAGVRSVIARTVKPLHGAASPPICSHPCTEPQVPDLPRRFCRARLQLRPRRKIPKLQQRVVRGVWRRQACHPTVRSRPSAREQTGGRSHDGSLLGHDPRSGQRVVAKTRAALCLTGGARRPSTPGAIVNCLSAFASYASCRCSGSIP
jgi:hypothetical protein